MSKESQTVTPTKKAAIPHWMPEAHSDAPKPAAAIPDWQAGLNPDGTTAKAKPPAIPQKYEPRFESDKELRAFLNEKQLLARLPISRRTLGNWKTKGWLPFIKIGRRCLYDWPNVHAALLRQQRGGETM